MQYSAFSSINFNCIIQNFGINLKPLFSSFQHFHFTTNLKNKQDFFIKRNYSEIPNVKPKTDLNSLHYLLRFEV